MRRLLSLILTILMLTGAVSACSVWRGSSDVDTDTGEGAVGNGPGLVTGKRGGIVIYQK